MCACVYICVSGRFEVCVYVISSLAALRNNCPECSLCLVMACCYLPPRCAEKKWLSNVLAFLDCSSLIQQHWMEPHLQHLTFKPISAFIKIDFSWYFFLIWESTPIETVYTLISLDNAHSVDLQVTQFYFLATLSLNFLALVVMTFQIWWVWLRWFEFEHYDCIITFTQLISA